MKTALSEKDQKNQLYFCLSVIDLNEPQFIDIFNIVHVDKKWFYMMKTSQKHYLMPLKEEQHC